MAVMKIARHVWLGFCVLFLIPAAVVIVLSGLPLTLIQLWIGP